MQYQLVRIHSFNLCSWYIVLLFIATGVIVTIFNKHRSLVSNFSLSTIFILFMNIVFP